MRRNLKSFGLVLVAALAMSAIAASAASAEQAFFTAAEYPVTVTGHEEGNENYFEFTPGRKMSCDEATTEATLQEASSQITVTGHVSGCESNGVAVTIDQNGCHSIVEVGEATSANVIHGSVRLVCPEGQQVKATIGTCQVDFPPQIVSGNAVVTNVPAEEGNAGYLTIESNSEGGISYTDTDGFLCPFEGSESFENGIVVGTGVAKGYEDVGSEAHATTSGRVEYLHGSQVDIHVGVRE